MKKSVDTYLDRAQFAAIGKLAAHWAYLETEIEFTITAMNTLVHDHQAIPFPFGDRMVHWRKLLPKAITSPHAVRYYKGIIRFATKAHDTRTRLLHGRVLGDPRRKIRLMATEHHQHRKGNWNSDTFYATPKRLEKAAAYMAKMTYSLISLNRRYLPIRPYALPNRYPALSPDGQPRARLDHIDSSIRKNPPRSLRVKLVLDRIDP